MVDLEDLMLEVVIHQIHHLHKLLKVVHRALVVAVVEEMELRLNPQAVQVL